MKTINAIFTSVIIKEDAVTTAIDFDYKEAEETMIRVLQGNFDIQTDDAFISMSEKPGEATPIFSYRAFLNNEEQPERPTGWENKNVKIFFDCPRCHSNKGTLKPDEDGDIIMSCSECSNPVLVK